VKSERATISALSRVFRVRARNFRLASPASLPIPRHAATHIRSAAYQRTEERRRQKALALIENRAFTSATNAIARFLPLCLLRAQVRRLAAPFPVQRHSTRLNTQLSGTFGGEVGRGRRKGTTGLYTFALGQRAGCRKRERCTRVRRWGLQACARARYVHTARQPGPPRGVYEHNSLKYSSALARSCLVPVINELKFGVATLPTTAPRPAVRLPAPISRVPSELSFWPSGENRERPSTPAPRPGKLYRCPLAEPWQLFVFALIFAVSAAANASREASILHRPFPFGVGGAGSNGGEGRGRRLLYRRVSA